MKGNEKEIQRNEKEIHGNENNFSNDPNAYLKIMFSLLKRAHFYNFANISFLRPPAPPELILIGAEVRIKMSELFFFIAGRGPN